MGQLGKVTVDGMTFPTARGRGARLARRGMIALVLGLLSTAALPRPAWATQFLDDFEGDGEVSQIPASSLRHWNIITSVDLLTESNAPLCRLSGSCSTWSALAAAGPAVS